jgi:type IV pilus assembly protein PilA
MFKALQKRLDNDEQGFTLIELMVVVLIIAILIAIAVPTFLGARVRAQDRAAQSDLRNALLAAEVHYVDAQDYNPTVAQLDAIEPEYTYNDDITLAAVDVIGYTGAATEIIFNRVSASGTSFGIAKTVAGGTFYCTGATTVATCTDDSW